MNHKVMRHKDVVCMHLAERRESDGLLLKQNEFSGSIEELLHQFG